ncbi:MAG: dynamin family protein [Paracoccaceae bacterium]
MWRNPTGLLTMEMTAPGETPAESIEPAPLATFTRQGLEPLEELRGRFEELQETLADIHAIGGEDVARKTRVMHRELDAFAPSVTFIGQIKSGKTTLVNAMAGKPGLLPADVNPWTSVVTSIHMNVPRPEGSPVASFTFFDEGEWDHLVQNGGRIGELSARTGADKEYERLQKQVAEMYEKTKARLGRKFELLLGQTHNYQHLDDSLVQRYVCLGDDFDTDSAQDRQGQFADITKSAELYIDAPNLPIAYTLRDTPGMNDTFMMREQITIRSIRDSKICVVALSAHQALNTVDMGLIRLISNVKSRQVIIFVNRVDELSDPAAQIPEIQESLVRTLAEHGGPEDPCVMFGSALWANAALAGDKQGLPEASLAALKTYAEFKGIKEDDELAELWTLSGLPALHEALGERITESAGEKMLRSVRSRAANIVSGLRASSAIVSLSANGAQLQRLSKDQIETLLDEIESSSRMNLDASLDVVFQKFDQRLDQAHSRFLSRALDALMQHLERNGDNEVWNYSPDGLRMLMRTAYQVMRKGYNSEVEDILSETAERLTQAYGRIFDVTQENFFVEAPAVPEVPPPVTIAQTIVLDVKTSWWKSWWGSRRGYRSFANGFHDLIESETTPMINALKVDQAGEIRALAIETLAAFLSEQRSVLKDISNKSEVNLQDLHGLFGVTSQEEREELFDIIFEELEIDAERMGAVA